MPLSAAYPSTYPLLDAAINKHASANGLIPLPPFTSNSAAMQGPSTPVRTGPSGPTTVPVNSGTVPKPLPQRTATPSDAAAYWKKLAGSVLLGNGVPAAPKSFPIQGQTALQHVGEWVDDMDPSRQNVAFARDMGQAWEATKNAGRFLYHLTAGLGSQRLADQSLNPTLDPYGLLDQNPKLHPLVSGVPSPQQWSDYHKFTNDSNAQLSQVVPSVQQIKQFPGAVKRYARRDPLGATVDAVTLLGSLLTGGEAAAGKVASMYDGLTDSLTAAGDLAEATRAAGTANNVRKVQEGLKTASTLGLNRLTKSSPKPFVAPYADSGAPAPIPVRSVSAAEPEPAAPTARTTQHNPSPAGLGGPAESSGPLRHTHFAEVNPGVEDAEIAPRYDAAKKYLMSKGMSEGEADLAIRDNMNPGFVPAINRAAESVGSSLRAQDATPATGTFHNPITGRLETNPSIIIRLHGPPEDAQHLINAFGETHGQIGVLGFRQLLPGETNPDIMLHVQFDRPLTDQEYLQFTKELATHPHLQILNPDGTVEPLLSGNTHIILTRKDGTRVSEILMVSKYSPFGDDPVQFNKAFVANRGTINQLAALIGGKSRAWTEKGRAYTYDYQGELAEANGDSRGDGLDDSGNSQAARSGGMARGARLRTALERELRRNAFDTLDKLSGRSGTSSH